MAGQRAADLQPMVYAPGYYTISTPRGARVSQTTTSAGYGRYVDGDRVRFHKGMAEKIGGWERQALTGANNGIYVGIARAVHDWSSLDTQQWLALGTQCKLYLVNTGTLSDITPLRKTSSVSAPFTTINTSHTVTVADPDHRANAGDHVRITGASAVGGLTLDGEYDIVSIVDPDHYTITAASAATSGATGGGSVTFEYDISCGLAENGELTGYGTGLFGMGTYGTPRAAGSGVPAKLRTWSLSNWGEDLVASDSDGEFYWWDRSTGPNARAQLVVTAPTNIQRMLVDVEFRRIILLGCTDLDGNPDRMEIRWCSSEDLQDWFPDVSNTAGEHRLDIGSRIVTGIITRTQKLVWTDNQLYSMSAISESDYGFDPKGRVSIAGPNAMVDDGGVVRFMAVNDFYLYDGTLRVIPCEVWSTVFDQANTTAIDLTQLEKVYAFTYQSKNETTWFYQSRIGTEVDRYVTYNSAMDCWYHGSMQRTAFHDVSEFLSGYMTNPYGVFGGYLYKHEVGTDEVEGSTTNVMQWFLQTGDAAAGGSDQNLVVNGLIPDFRRLTVGMRVTLKAKERPLDTEYVVAGPYDFDTDDTDWDATISGSQLTFLFETAVDGNGDPIAGQDWRMGTLQVEGFKDGGK